MTAGIGKRTSARGVWHTSSYSGDMGNCVEVVSLPRSHGVRDTQDRDGATLGFATTEWTAFVNSVKHEAL
ncbi:DUF397 domain-containing protein [Nocardiopsis ansamitocini]|uniref:DUF397 domain-containing protein n=1 Tax=Nocardiopsis ansamitocini TaxID=1670832 RepID=A0A9W6UHJ3_9ACTN|nr:DUF397 domain-containing protein [Nocardiopsis ansamitocini]GLU46684.1 hypothetical protein Nans01_10350 [Nocardiopsis ansamitocini]